MPVISYHVADIVPYIDWTYFFHAWKFQPRFAGIAHTGKLPDEVAAWIAAFPAEEQAKATEAARLFEEACLALKQMDRKVEARCLYRLCKANSRGDDIVVEDGTVIPCLRQQTPQIDGGYSLCLSDFIRPMSSGIGDTVGLFASSVNAMQTERQEDGRDKDAYSSLLAQTLCDRLVEAATEKLHEYIRKEVWGYAHDESLTMQDMLTGKFQGIRPAVGYPSLPDQSIVFIIDRLLGMQQIGISLTENGAMQPHSSVCGLMLAHPASRYFHIGPIGEDQLKDYAERRGLPLQEIRKFLSASIIQA